MNINNNDEAERLISEFLEQHERPTSADWRNLTDQYPQYASKFADAALVRAVGDAADASDQAYAFDPVLATSTVSKALNKAHQVPSATVDRAAACVAEIHTPAARREIATAVGIGQHTSLLNGVLAGRTRPPRPVLEALAARFEVPATALLTVFERAFASSTVPAHKSGESKPQVSVEPVSWTAAVRGLSLPPEETTRLLALSSED